MTGNEMRRKAAVYLSRYRAAKAEARDIERRIEGLYAEMMGVKGISYEGGDMPKQTFRAGDLSDYVARLDGVIREWQAAQVRALEVMREVSAAINAVEHGQARRVLMLHFVDGYSFERIAADVPCDISTVFRWRRLGLKAVAEKMP